MFTTFCLGTLLYEFIYEFLLMLSAFLLLIVFISLELAVNLSFEQFVLKLITDVVCLGS